ncbi:MAG: single-stranded DNA-binding protein [Blastocatellia bacterium]
MSFNKIIIVGHLGRDPELRYTPQGVAVCNFSVATSDKKKDKAGEMQDITTWFRVTLWRQQAENAAKYLTKGRQVYIEGRLGVEEWTDRDGNNRHTLEVQGTEMHFIGSRADGASDSQSNEPHDTEFAGPVNASSPPPTAKAAAADDDIPF